MNLWFHENNRKVYWSTVGLLVFNRCKSIYQKWVINSFNLSSNQEPDSLKIRQYLFKNENTLGFTQHLKASFYKLLNENFIQCIIIWTNLKMYLNLNKTRSHDNQLPDETTFWPRLRMLLTPYLLRYFTKMT